MGLLTLVALLDASDVFCCSRPEVSCVLCCRPITECCKRLQRRRAVGRRSETRASWKWSCNLTSRVLYLPLTGLQLHAQQQISDANHVHAAGSWMACNDLHLGHHT